jgi:DnaJ-domain-containing protein 1
MADINQYRDSSDPLLRAAYWLAAASWWSPKDFNTLQELSKLLGFQAGAFDRLAALEAENARLRSALERIVYADATPARDGILVNMPGAMEQARAALADG